MSKRDPALHLLPLSRSQRAHYAGLGALALHASGREVLLGLGPRESEFVVACGGKVPDAVTARERLRLAGLLARHERARLMGMPGARRPVKNEAGQG